MVEQYIDSIMHDVIMKGICGLFIETLYRRNDEVCDNQ